jgi:hypothetical protein
MDSRREIQHGRRAPYSNLRTHTTPMRGTFRNTYTHTHRCWRIIHAELGRLASSKWRFICINGGKNLKTIWNELEDEFPKVFTFCSVQTLENAAMEQARHRPFAEAEERKHKAGTTKEKIVLDRLWNKRPDGFAIKMPTNTKAGELVILEFQRMSCVTDKYVKRARHVAEAQCVHKASTRKNPRSPRMDRESKKLHSRSKISEREGPT